jgi:hypothetical protein
MSTAPKPRQAATASRSPSPPDPDGSIAWGQHNAAADQCADLLDELVDLIEALPAAGDALALVGRIQERSAFAGEMAYEAVTRLAAARNLARAPGVSAPPAARGHACEAQPARPAFTERSPTAATKGANHGRD